MAKVVDKEDLWLEGEPPIYTGSGNKIGGGTIKCPFADDDHDVPELIKVYFKNAEGEEIQSLIDQEEVHLVIASKNGQNAKVAIELTQNPDVFFLNDVKVAKDHVILVELDRDEIDIKLTVTAPRLSISFDELDFGDEFDLLMDEFGDEFKEDLMGVAYFHLSVDQKFDGSFGFDWLYSKREKLKHSVGYYYHNESKKDVEVEETSSVQWTRLKSDLGITPNKLIEQFGEKHCRAHLTLRPGVSAKFRLNCQFDKSKPIQIEIKGAPEELILELDSSLKEGDNDLKVTCASDLKENAALQVVATADNLSEIIIGEMVVHRNPKIKKLKVNVVLVETDEGDIVSMQKSMDKEKIKTWLNEGFNQAYLECGELNVMNLDMKRYHDIEKSFSKVYKGGQLEGEEKVEGPMASLYAPTKLYSGLTDCGKMFFRNQVDQLKASCEGGIMRSEHKWSYDDCDLLYFIFDHPCHFTEEVKFGSERVQRILDTSTGLNGRAEAPIGKGKKIVVFKNGQKPSTFVHEGLHNLGLYHTFNEPGDPKCKFQYKIHKTDNIMDYCEGGGDDNRLFLYKWQWEVLWEKAELII